jgi:hypothetical protein
MYPGNESRPSNSSGPGGTAPHSKYGEGLVTTGLSDRMLGEVLGPNSANPVQTGGPALQRKGGNRARLYTLENGYRERLIATPRYEISSR